MDCQHNNEQEERASTLVVDENASNNEIGGLLDAA